MKKTVFQIILSLLCFSAQAQKVSKIRAEQNGQDIVVHYTLETASPCEVNLFLSQDNGSTWIGPLKNVSGDVGRNVYGGESQITWKVLAEQEQLVGNRIKFKVVAKGKEVEVKTFDIEMVLVEGGSFQMGSDFGEGEEGPIHSVTVGTFKIGKYEVTQTQWNTVMGSIPSYFKECENCPVENVSWNDAQRFIRKLNILTAKNYRLPTEAEWEFAAKGGNKSKGYTYSGSNDLNSVAWSMENSEFTPHAIHSKQANELGIYDMSGNVWEWCSDWYGVYNSYSETNPKGIAYGQQRVIRGGSWDYNATSHRSSGRSKGNQGSSYNDFGFRLVLPVDH